jgi:hypothetical protein
VEQAAVKQRARAHKETTMHHKSEIVPLTTDGVHNHAVEFAPSKERAKAIYYVLDGKRIAERKDGKWLSIVPGYEVTSDMSIGEFEVYFDGRILH